MKTMVLSTVIELLIASPVQAVPLTWVFSGTTLSNSGCIDENDVLRNISGRSFEFRIFLDTNLPGTVIRRRDTVWQRADGCNPNCSAWGSATDSDSFC